MDIVALIVKAVTSGALVFGLSLVAERVSPRVAGVLSGAPLGALIAYFFLGREAGIDFVVKSVPHAVSSMTGVMSFVCAYYAASTRARRHNALTSTVVGLAGYLLAALVLIRIDFNIPGALALSVSAALLTAFVLRGAVDIRVVSPVRMTPRLLALRAGLAALLVVSVVGVAKLLGPVWAGVVMGFPMTFLPTVLIVHLTYSRDHVHALLQGFPLGIGAVLGYMLSLPLTFPVLGVGLGTLASLAVGLSYLAGLSALLHIIKKRH